MTRRLWGPALALALVCTLASCGGGEGGSDSEIAIGEYDSLTGTTATFGISTRNGIDMAIDSVNRAGGVLGPGQEEEDGGDAEARSRHGDEDDER